MRVEKYLKRKINRKIIKFFLENLSSIDTPRGIATWINEDVDKTKKALKELADARILVFHGADTTSAYACTSDKRVIAGLRICLKRKS
ncbi:MAG: hypothetical protein U9R52_01345 [Candidatus Omnitrophota bacterium]|nr:hypothetical protein [Candidatus Omnitrophota bacterium]